MLGNCRILCAYKRYLIVDGKMTLTSKTALNRDLLLYFKSTRQSIYTSAQIAYPKKTRTVFVCRITFDYDVSTSQMSLKIAFLKAV